MTQQEGSADGTGSVSSEWSVGTATRVITPERPMRMAGYGARTGRSDGVGMDIHAKAVAFEDGGGNRAVIVSAEVLGITRRVRDAVEDECERRYDLAPDELLLNASHTHQGPEYREDEWDAWEFDPEDDRRATEYRERLEAELVDVVGGALSDAEPARLRYSHARCGIAMNRRLPTEEGVRFSQYPDGAVDHDVPVLVASRGETVSAVVFGYACHPTSLPGDTKYHGDWAGYAVEFVEAEFPDATAAFVQGCGGEFKAYPQDGEERTRQHGRSLANAVRAAVDAEGTPVRGPLKTVEVEIPFEFADQPDREELEAVAESGEGEGEERTFGLRRGPVYARRLLDELDESGSITTEFPYPVQAIGFGTDLTLIGLAGETMVDYSLRLKRELEGNVWVAGYSNVGYFYVPSARNVYEGGYESGWVQVYAEYPAPPKPENEDRIVGTARSLAERVGARSRPRR